VYVRQANEFKAHTPKLLFALRVLVLIITLSKID